MLVTKNEKKLPSAFALLLIITRAFVVAVESSTSANISATASESLVVVDKTICVTEASVALLNLRIPEPGLPELVEVEKS
jgi:hypothetical protein